MKITDHVDVHVVCDRCRAPASVRRGRTFLCAGCALGAFHPLPASLPSERPCENCGRQATVWLGLRLLCTECTLEQESRSLLASSRNDAENALDEVLAARQEARSQVALELHDDTVQVMTSAFYQLSLIRLEIVDPQVRRAIDGIQQEMRAAIARLRHLMFELKPGILETQGLGSALRFLLVNLEQRFGLEYRLEERLASDPDPATSESLYLIANEALANVRKHASADHVDIVIEEREEGISMRIQDDGVGFRPEQAEVAEHLGLAAMRERARAVGGQIRLEAAPGAGTLVECRIPA
jgi:signal transduction histidine kinase